MSVGLVVVSHSAKIAEGVVELAGQMADGVRILPAGGTDGDGIGTSFEKVRNGIEGAQSGDGVVILCDLGSAVLTAETALEFLDDASAVRIAAAPVVEGAVAAAVAARTGGDLDVVLAAAERAGASESGADEAKRHPSRGALERHAVLANDAGLHARPAAMLVTAASDFDAAVTVNGVDAKSLLRIMGLGVGKGDELRLTADGPDAEAALDALVALIESGFGESGSRAQ